ncbi:MAG TPA: hypothetical protein VK177_03095 [Flavobacteriales bacterium]|nr:hypothetical protein [Flavobacteriales bacterium]
MNLKITLWAVFAFNSFTNLNAQEQFNDFWDWSTYYFIVYPTKNMGNKDVSEVKMIHQGYKRSGKPSKKPGISFKKFDENGRPVEMLYTDKKGILRKGITMVYDQNGQKTHIELYRKSVLRHKTSFTYASKGKYSEIINTNKDGEINWKSTWTYNADGCVTESAKFKKGTKLKRRWTYEYYDKCKLARSFLYNGRGKLKNTWSYDCKEEGQKLEKKKNEIQVCYWEQSSIDYITKVAQTFDEKGKLVKYVSKFTAKDTLPVEHTTYDEKDRLVTRYTYNKSWDLQTSRSRYKKNGKQLWEVTYEYMNDSLLVREISTRKGKIDERTEYAYNSESLLTQKKVFGTNGKPRFAINMEYVTRK